MSILLSAFERCSPVLNRLGLLTFGLVAGGLGLTEAQAGERLAPEQRPETWDMSIEELQAIGLGQSRGNPVPVPAEYPRFNTEPRPVGDEGPPPDPWVIFVNFDGETLTEGMDSAQDNITQVPLMGGEFAPYGEGDKRGAVMQAVMADWAAYNMLVVDERPESGEYVMNLTGPTNPFGGGVLGIAPVDCSNQQTHSNITYAFHSADDMFSAPITATTIGQEVAHSFGLEHVDEPNDIMNPYNAGGDPTFIDECIQIVGQLACPDQHMAECGEPTAQNAHLELLTLFGPAFVDTGAPTVVITSPFDGLEFADAPATVNVIASASDNVEIASVRLEQNGGVVETLTEEPWQWTADNLGEGVYAFQAFAVDAAGNEGMSNEVTVVVGAPGGSGGEDTDGDTDGAGADDDGEGCGCRSAGPLGPTGGAMLMLLALGLVRRRR